VLSGLGFCEACGSSRVEVALELFVGERNSACLRCRLAAKTLSWVLKTGAKPFGVDVQTMKEQFRHPYWRKSLANVLSGIAQFGVQRPFVTGMPFLIVWDVTHACNLRCRHCYAGAGEPAPDELTTREAKSVIDELDRVGIPLLALSGGEPLVREDLLELVGYARDRGFYVALATNGTLITKSKARELREAGIQFVQISLDGASATTHDRFRGIDGVFERTIQGIENCVEEGFFVNIAATATRDNYREIPKIIDLCEERGVTWFMVYNFVPTGRGALIADHDLTPEEREALLNLLWERSRDSTTVEVLSMAPQFARVALEAEIGKDTKVYPTHFSNSELPGKLANLAEFIGGCVCGRFYAALRPNGDIEPCVFFPLAIGNILQDDFTELWRSNPVLNDLRNKDKLGATCGQCDYRYYCGGCRARAYAYTGDYLAADPGCVRNAD
jgi:radical SAM protein with 4Fe4S-binding SPASM domain